MTRPAGDSQPDAPDTSDAPDPPEPSAAVDEPAAKPPPTTVGQRLRAMRTEQHLTLSEVSRLSGVSKGYLSQLERSPTTRPSAATMFALADVLGASVDELYSGLEIVPYTSRIVLPPGLREYVEEAELTPTETAMLARIHYRGESPETKQDWCFLYEAIRRSVGPKN